MQKWVYCWLTYSGGGKEFSFQIMAPDQKEKIYKREQLEEFIHWLGGNGWELVNLAIPSDQYGTTFHWFFKRPME